MNWKYTITFKLQQQGQSGAQVEREALYLSAVKYVTGPE